MGEVMGKIWAIMGGGDWADASVEFVVQDEGTDEGIEGLINDWKSYRDRRSDLIRINAVNGSFYEIPRWIGLAEWLKDCGCRMPTKDELEEYWDE